jgi:hypothetical protein
MPTLPGTIFDLSSVANCSRMMLWSIYKNCGKKKTFVSRKAEGLCQAKHTVVPNQTLCQAIHRARKLDRGKNLRHRAAPELLTRNLTFLTFIFTQNTVQQEGFVEVSFFSGGLFFHQYILLWRGSFWSYFLFIFLL